MSDETHARERPSTGSPARPEALDTPGSEPTRRRRRRRRRRRVPANGNAGNSKPVPHVARRRAAPSSQRMRRAMRALLQNCGKFIVRQIAPKLVAALRWSLRWLLEHLRRATSRGLGWLRPRERSVTVWRRLQRHRGLAAALSARLAWWASLLLLTKVASERLDGFGSGPYTEHALPLTAAGLLLTALAIGLAGSHSRIRIGAFVLGTAHAFAVAPIMVRRRIVSTSHNGAMSRGSAVPPRRPATIAAAPPDHDRTAGANKLLGRRIPANAGTLACCRSTVAMLCSRTSCRPRSSAT